MLQHSFVLDALETTAGDTFSHFEVLIEEHRALEHEQLGTITAHSGQPHSRSLSSLPSLHQQSRLRQLVPTIGSFHTPLPLREAFEAYNEKHQLTKRKHITISFNEIRHILNLAQIIALRKNFRENGQRGFEGDGAATDESQFSTPTNSRDALAHANSGDDLGVEELEDSLPRGQLRGPRMVTFDGDQTLYSDGANFESNPRLAFYLYQLLRHGVIVAVVTAAGYEYNVEKYEYRLSGLLHYFQQRGLTEEQCGSFYLFGGECNYLLKLGSDFRLHAVREIGPGGWCTSTRFLTDCPGNWSESEVKEMLDVSERIIQNAIEELNLRGRVIRKRRSVGLIPLPSREMTRESLDEVVGLLYEWGVVG
jgi:IMP-specific 5'-nucleotidase